MSATPAVVRNAFSSIFRSIFRRRSQLQDERDRLRAAWDEVAELFHIEQPEVEQLVAQVQWCQAEHAEMTEQLDRVEATLLQLQTAHGALRDRVEACAAKWKADAARLSVTKGSDRSYAQACRDHAADLAKLDELQLPETDG